MKVGAHNVEKRGRIGCHAEKHHADSAHPIALSLSDMSFWCYLCEAYIENKSLHLVRDEAIGLNLCTNAPSEEQTTHTQVIQVSDKDLTIADCQLPDSLLISKCNHSIISVATGSLENISVVCCENCTVSIDTHVASGKLLVQGCSDTKFTILTNTLRIELEDSAQISFRLHPPHGPYTITTKVCKEISISIGDTLHKLPVDLQSKTASYKVINGIMSTSAGTVCETTLSTPSPQRCSQGTSVSRRYNNMTVVKLRAILHRRGLPVSGLKAVLIRRLQDYDLKHPSATECLKSSSDSESDSDSDSDSYDSESDSDGDSHSDSDEDDGNVESARDDRESESSYDSVGSHPSDSDYGQPSRKKSRVTKKKVGFHPRFKLPTEQEVLDAILTSPDEEGPLSKWFDPNLCRLQVSTNTGADHTTASTASAPLQIPFFPPLPRPTHQDDWLAQYPEHPQSVHKYINSHHRALRMIREGKTKAYIVVIGSPCLFGSSEVNYNYILEFARIFFMPLNFEFLPPLSVVNERKSLYLKVPTGSYPSIHCGHYTLTHRVAHPYDRHKMKKTHRQLAVDPILSVLHRITPPEALCVVGVTMEDLYDGRTDSFVAGMAHGGSGQAIFSFARYDPLFAHRAMVSPTEPFPCDIQLARRLLLERCCKLMAHEIGHLFGIGHCVYRQCLMNGSGHLAEDYAQPMNLCPCDLRKLHLLLQFDVVQRYTRLRDFGYTHSLVDFADWINAFLMSI
ncbi:Zn-dependent protease [Pelomyxa schiedti]|nr:Zn-dependent protease [Pelomyxa schiedti]